MYMRYLLARCQNGSICVVCAAAVIVVVVVVVMLAEYSSVLTVELVCKDGKDFGRKQRGTRHFIYTRTQHGDTWTTSTSWEDDGHDTANYQGGKVKSGKLFRVITTIGELNARKTFSRYDNKIAVVHAE